MESGEPMSMPYYVAPEQMMKDKADYARKGIARGRSLLGVTYAGGIDLTVQPYILVWDTDQKQAA